MKYVFSSILTTILLAHSGAAQASWFSKSEEPVNSQEQSPDSKMWSGFGTTVGAFDYEINSTPGDSALFGSPHEDKSMGYKIGIEYAVGYRPAFEFRTRCSLGIGFSDLVDATSLSVDIPSKTYLFNLDATFFFPISLNKKAGLSLVPSVGFGVHQNYTKLTADASEESTKGSFYRNRLLSPFCGLYLQLIPTDKLFFRSGFTVQFPYGSERFVSAYFSEDESRKSLGSRRHGTGAEFVVNYAVSKKACITASLNMLSLSVGGASSLYFRSKEVNYMLGFLYSF